MLICTLGILNYYYYYYYYFQSQYKNDLFEVKGVHFNAVPNSIVLPQDFAHETVNFNLSGVVAIYSLCFSIMKSCSYSNSNTLATIVDNSKRVHDNVEMGVYHHLIYQKLLIQLNPDSSNLALTRTKIDFPCISFIHLL